MSSRAKRLTSAPSVARFEWASGGRSGAAAPAPDSPFPAVREIMPPPPPSAPCADTIERDAFAKGYAQGEKAGQEASAARCDAMLRRLTQTLEELTELRSEMIHHTERQMVQLALAVARRIVHREVSLDQDLLIAMARVALDRLGDGATVTVRLSPDDYAATAECAARSCTGTNVTVVGDARVSRGGCRIESNFGTLDAGVDAQIQELGRALLGEALPAVEVEVGVLA